MAWFSSDRAEKGQEQDFPESFLDFSLADRIAGVFIIPVFVRECFAFKEVIRSNKVRGKIQH